MSLLPIPYSITQQITALEVKVEDIGTRLNKYLNGNGRGPLLERVALLENNVRIMNGVLKSVAASLESLEESIKGVQMNCMSHEPSQNIIKLLDDIKANMSIGSATKPTEHRLLIMIIAGLVLTIVALVLGPGIASKLLI